MAYLENGLPLHTHLELVFWEPLKTANQMPLHETFSELS